MSDEPGQQEQAEEEDAESGPIDFLDPCLALGDGECWIADAELLLPGEDDAEGED